MLCHVSLPDYVLTEFKLREKARGQELLQAVRILFLVYGLKVHNFALNGIFHDFFVFPFVYLPFSSYLCFLGLQKTRYNRIGLFWSAVYRAEG